MGETMPKTRRTKKVIIIEEFIEKINSGELISGSEFPSMDELTHTYDISSRTAGAVIRALSKMGLLDTHRGRRSLVRSEIKTTTKPKFEKPIGIIMPEASMLRYVSWRSWLVKHIGERLELNGYQSQMIAENFTVDDLTDKYSGVIVAGELLCEKKWDEIQMTGLPYAGISFNRPFPDMVYIDYRYALDELALYLAKRKCRKFIHISSFEREARTVFGWYSKIGFLPVIQAYGIDRDGCHHPIVPPDKTACEKALGPLLFNSSEKAALLVTNTSYHQIIIEIMKDHGQRLGTNYELVSLSHTPQDKAVGCCINQKCVEIADKLLAILYQRQLSNKPQISKLIQAAFYAKTPSAASAEQK